VQYLIRNRHMTKKKPWQKASPRLELLQTVYVGPGSLGCRGVFGPHKAIEPVQCAAIPIAAIAALCRAEGRCGLWAEATIW
jgi:hypothetical protein